MSNQRSMDFIYTFGRIIKFIPILIGHWLLSIPSWFVPRSWYAKKVDKEVVLITGAGSGLGRDIALEYAKLGSHLILWDINETGLEETKHLVENEYSNFDEKRKCLIYVVDVSDRNIIKKTAIQVHIDLNHGNNPNEKPRYVSVLVNNAGIYYGRYLQDISDEQIEKIFNINILAHFWTVRAFLPEMIKNEHGHIVEIASMGGILGLYKQVDYCATKFATVGFEQSLGMELDHLGLGDKIRTTVVCPFFFSSNLFSNFNDKVASLMSSKYVAREAVLTMRCNHSQVFLPRLYAYPLHIMRGLLTRKLIVEATLTLSSGFENIVGNGSKLLINRDGRH